MKYKNNILAALALAWGMGTALTGCTNDDFTDGYGNNAGMPAVINLSQVAEKPGFGSGTQSHGDTETRADGASEASDSAATRATTVGTNGVPVSAWTEGDAFKVMIITGKNSIGSKQIIVYYDMKYDGSDWQQSFSNAIVTVVGGGAPTKITTEAAALATLHELAAVADDADKLQVSASYNRHYSDPGDADFAPLGNNFGTETMMATDVRVNGKTSDDDTGNSHVFSLSSIYAGSETEGVMTLNLSIGGWERTSGLVIVENVTANKSATIESDETTVSGSGTDAVNTLYLHAPAGTYNVMIQGDTPKTLAVAASTYYVLDASLGPITPGNPVANQDFSYDPTYKNSSDVTVGLFTIYTGKGLKLVSDLINDDDNGSIESHITLANNIDMSTYDGNYGSGTDDGSKTYAPIGDYANYYTGIFNGGGHTIYNLTVSGSDEAPGGLVGYLGTDGEVTDVKLVKATVTDDFTVGGIVGENSGTVSGCAISDSKVTGEDNVGGIVGSNYGGTVTGCTASDSKVTGESYVGGVVGVNTIDSSSSVSNCHATDVEVVTTTQASGSDYVGIVIGYDFKISSGAPYNGTTGDSGTVTINGTTKTYVDGTEVDYTYNESEESFTIYTGKGLKLVSDIINGNAALDGTSAWDSTDRTDWNITLAADIDMSAYTNADGTFGTADDYTPIGDNTTNLAKYTGTFDGNGKTISNLTIGTESSKYTSQNCGLIGYLYTDGKVENVKLSGVKIYGSNNVGGIVGKMENSTVTGCTVTSSNITGVNGVGGIAGFVSNSSYVGSSSIESDKNIVNGVAVTKTSNQDDIGIIKGDGTGTASTSGNILKGTNTVNGKKVNNSNGSVTEEDGTASPE